MSSKKLIEEISDNIDQLLEADGEQLMSTLRSIHEKVEPSRKVYDLKEQDIMKVLKVSYIAQRFFGKSRSWLCHKLNHNIVNGKPDDFTPQERQKLKEALDTIAYEIQILSDNIEP